MNKKQLVIVDFQKHFKYQAPGDFSSGFDSSFEFKQVVDNLKKNFKKYNEIVLVVDAGFINSGTDYYFKVEDLENIDYFDSAEDYEDFLDRNERLIHWNIDFDLIMVLDKLLVNNEIPNIKILNKEYGPFRGLMDNHLDIILYIFEIKRQLNDRDLDDVTDEEYINDEEEYIENDKVIKGIMEVLYEEYDMDTEDVWGVLYDYQYVLPENQSLHYDNDTLSREGVILGGGGAMECLLEEYISMDYVGRVENIEIDEDLVYGEKYELLSVVEDLEEQRERIDEIRRGLRNNNKNDKNKINNM